MFNACIYPFIWNCKGWYSNSAVSYAYSFVNWLFKNLRKKSFYGITSLHFQYYPLAGGTFLFFSQCGNEYWWWILSVFIYMKVSLFNPQLWKHYCCLWNFRLTRKGGLPLSSGLSVPGDKLAALFIFASVCNVSSLPPPNASKIFSLAMMFNSLTTLSLIVLFLLYLFCVVLLNFLAW